MFMADENSKEYKEMKALRELQEKAEKLTKEVEALRKERDDAFELKADYERVKKQFEEYRQEHQKEGNYLQLFGSSYGNSGIRIPLGDEMRKEIAGYIKEQISVVIANDPDFKKSLTDTLFKYRKALLEIFDPIVKEILEKKLDNFNVKLKFTEDKDE